MHEKGQCWLQICSCCVLEKKGQLSHRKKIVYLTKRGSPVEISRFESEKFKNFAKEQNETKNPYTKSWKMEGKDLFHIELFFSHFKIQNFVNQKT